MLVYLFGPHTETRLRFQYGLHRKSFIKYAVITNVNIPLTIECKINEQNEFFNVSRIPVLLAKSSIAYNPIIYVLMTKRYRYATVICSTWYYVGIQNLIAVFLNLSVQSFQLTN